MLLTIALAVLAVPASAASLPASCLHVSSGTAPSNYEEFRACQARTLDDALASAERKGAPVTDAQLDAIDEFQRTEARKFLSRKGTVIGGGATAADLGRADPKSADAIKGLQGRLQAAAGDGKDGITPEMAADVRATLMQSQGGISPDMKDLLDSVERDGGKLTPETMKKLQGAGKAAKGDGLDLNIDPNTEKLLLEHDFDKDKAPAEM
ncbi:MAG: hypothetical protein ACHQ2Z_03950 [Elusimicrobiota bacterium]